MTSLANQIKEELKRLGVDSESEAFQVIFNGAMEKSELLTMGQLKNWIFEQSESLPSRLFEVPTFKEKYGRCEDAPCCGCCGNDYWESASEDYDYDY